MKKIISLIIFAAHLVCVFAQNHPYLTTRTPITLLSANDGETAPFDLTTPDGLADWDLKRTDSFTVIQLGPDHPPIIKTVFDKAPVTIWGTPSMAMSKNGRYGLIANHGFRNQLFAGIVYPKDNPLTNKDLTPELLIQQQLPAHRANIVSLIDLSTQDFKVVHRVLFDDYPFHVLAHPDGEHFVVGASENFYVFKILNNELVLISKNPQAHGHPCFWISPNGKRIIATQNHGKGETCTVQWYSMAKNKIKHLSTVEIADGVDTKLLDTSMILRISLDGKIALICQRSVPNGLDFCDIPIVDLTLEKPAITSVIKQVADGVESFAFHPNRKMAVVTGLGKPANCIGVLDIASKPARLLYTIDAKAIGQGIEFTPEGDKLFVGSATSARIEVFDVIGDYELRKNPKFLRVGYGHSSLTIGPRYNK